MDGNNPENSGENQENNAAAQGAPDAPKGRKRKTVITVIFVLLAVLLCFAIWQVIRLKTSGLGRISDRADMAAAQADREALAQYDPSADGGRGVAAAAAEVNGNIVAWLTLSGTDISYPVLEADNNSYYADHSVNEVPLSTGAIFLDYHCSRRLTDYNNIIYGNNVSDGSMFAQLTKYADESFFAENTAGSLYTADGVYTVTVIAALYTADGADKVYATALASDTEKAAFLAAVKAEALQYREVQLEGDERIITLSTCTSGLSGRQMAVVGLIREQ